MQVSRHIKILIDSYTPSPLNLEKISGTRIFLTPSALPGPLMNGTAPRLNIESGTLASIARLRGFVLIRAIYRRLGGFSVCSKLRSCWSQNDKSFEAWGISARRSTKIETPSIRPPTR